MAFAALRCLGPGLPVLQRKGQRDSGPRPAAGFAEGDGTGAPGRREGVAERTWGWGQQLRHLVDERPSDSGSLTGEGVPSGARGPGGKGAWGQLLKCGGTPEERRGEGRAFPVPGLRVRPGRRGAFMSEEGEYRIVGGKLLGGRGTRRAGCRWI